MINFDFINQSIEYVETYDDEKKRSSVFWNGILEEALRTGDKLDKIVNLVESIIKEKDIMAFIQFVEYDGLDYERLSKYVKYRVPKFEGWLKHASFACSTDDSRGQLQGVCIDYHGDGKMNYASTDGRRLYISRDFDVTPDMPVYNNGKKMLVKIGTFEDWTSYKGRIILKEEKAKNFAPLSNQVHSQDESDSLWEKIKNDVNFGSSLFFMYNEKNLDFPYNGINPWYENGRIWKILNGEYPNYRSIIPDNVCCEVNHLERLIPQLKLGCEIGKITNNECIRMKFSDTTTCCYNPKYMLDGIERLNIKDDGDDEVNVMTNIPSGFNPNILKNEFGDIYLIMQMRG